MEDGIDMTRIPAIDFAKPSDMALPLPDLQVSSGDLAVPSFDLSPRLTDMARTVSVTTFAGSGSASDLDGPANVATFMCPSGIALDPNGSVYVSDATGNVIRKITPAGIVSTLAGTGASGYVDGPGQTAEFDGPSAIAFEQTGRLVVADWQNNRIRMVAGDGTTSTLAGDGVYGYRDGPVATAEFIEPTSIVVTDAIYVGDYSYTIRKITFDGTVSTFSGSGTMGSSDGPPSTAEYQHVQSFASSGTNLIITDVTTVRSVAKDGSVTTIVPQIQGGASGIVIDDQGFIYFATYGYNNQVIEISPTGTVQPIAGAGPQGFADGPGATALFDSPQNIVSRTHGDLLLSDCDNHRVREVRF